MDTAEYLLYSETWLMLGLFFIMLTYTKFIGSKIMKSTTANMFKIMLKIKRINFIIVEYVCAYEC